KYGYKVVAHEKFAVGTTDFSSYIADAKKAGAQVLIAQMIPPDAIALWKQMKALHYVPRAAFCEKCASVTAFALALGKVSDGTLNNDGGYTPSTHYPRAAEFQKRWAKKLGAPETSFLVETYSAAAVMLDAMKKA